MSQIDCNACAELRETAPEFVQNGVTTRVCTSLKNDTGFNPSLTVAHTDCQDLDTANDCLIGEMDAKIEAHDVCDWKQYMHKLVPNLYEMLKAMICAMCGLWTRIHAIEHNTQTLMKIKRKEYMINNIECAGESDVNIMIDISQAPAGFTYMAIGSVEVRNALPEGQRENKMAIIEYHTSGGLTQVWLHLQNTSSGTAKILIKVNVLFCQSANIEFIGAEEQQWTGPSAYGDDWS